ncbi:nitronate monooxygenase [Mesorhizobium sp. LHD-90]|uniref:NAD(P)H-dependent flavin oxidoreductase n=1 Tax=Mesorhizobium sp. LHD-90 TaxID=3071414 RepID=UPI0027DF6979|nr:nitronate monooxygenase [Mesorhizobium sp. LHD-90]MDQ6436183.1 nitronate monooxygenase [Mesorhizobium sp. LHD-90]
MWPDRRILELFDIDVPILLAPMAGPVLADMAVAVANAGGLGALPCAMLNLDQARAELEKIRLATNAPINLNFFCHTPPVFDEAREKAWRERLKPYYEEFGVDPAGPIPVSNRTPFDETFSGLIEEFRPKVVSFHFGLPEPALLERVKATGAKVISSATTVREAVWLEQRGCDAIIAQGAEAGGHRGIFLGDDVSHQVGTFALVPQVVDAVKVPVIAAGGIADARGIVAALALGAAAVQIGTAYLFCPEAKLSPPHRAALKGAWDDDTVLTRIFTGRPARSIANRAIREVGAMSDLAPAFPLAGGALAPLRARTEPAGSGDFMPLWSGQAMRLGREMPAKELTLTLAEEALRRLARLAR